MRITVVGTGYVGLVTGVCFAEMGNDVIGLDVDEAKVAQLHRGESPIFEPGLSDLIQRNLRESRLQFTTELSAALAEAEIIFIAVGTPSDRDGAADLSYVLNVASDIAENLKHPATVVIKSTVPVGTHARVKSILQSKLEPASLRSAVVLVSNPEFLKEGTAVEDCLRPSRVVIGCEGEPAREQMARLYEPFLWNGNPIHFVDPRSAELAKYAANAMLATKISFMNELSQLCEKVGADIENVRLALGSDPRIGYHFIYAGLGFGGSCFPKDIRALLKTGDDAEVDLRMLKAVLDVNESQRRHFFNKIYLHFGANFKDRRIALWGLAFKPGTDDVREAPALDLIQWLTEAGAQVVAFDPVARATAQNALGENPAVHFGSGAYEVLEGADALCVVTEWKSFREPNFDRMRDLMKTPVVFDGRNIFSPEHIKQKGFTYYSVGR